MIYQQLYIRKKDLEAELEKIENTIKAMQEICSHTDENSRQTYDWRGNHAQYNIYQCTQCGHENKV